MAAILNWIDFKSESVVEVSNDYFLQVSFEFIYRFMEYFANKYVHICVQILLSSLVSNNKFAVYRVDILAD